MVYIFAYMTISLTSASGVSLSLRVGGKYEKVGGKILMTDVDRA